MRARCHLCGDSALFEWTLSRVTMNVGLVRGLDLSVCEACLKAIEQAVTAVLDERRKAGK